MRIVSIMLICACAAQDTGDLASLTTEQRRLNLESFELVWSTVRDQHWDPTLGGIDWNAAHAAALPKIRTAKSMFQARQTMTDMLRSLHQSHFAIIPGGLYRKIEPAAKAEKPNAAPAATPRIEDFRQEECGAGIEAAVVEGHATVIAVVPDSSAARLGVRSGWWIQSVDQDPVAEAVQVLAKSDLAERAMYEREIVEGAFRGPLEQVVDAVFVDGEGAEHAITLERIVPKGNLAHFGFIPETRVWLESRSIAPKIGYVRFNMFLDAEHLMPAFEQAVRDCLSCDGFVIDLRGNHGGIGGMSMGMAGWFFARGGRKLGTLKGRGYSIQFEINPRADTFDGPLAVLVDGATASTSEIFAAGLQDLHRAQIFGEKTAGMALPSTVMRLPNGDGFQYAQATYSSTGGKVLEGNGVTPDVAVSQTRSALLSGHDAVVDAAVQWIRSKKEGHD